VPAAPALIDSGPLYALFDRSDAYHAQAKQVLKEFRGQLITNLAVLQEVHFLLAFHPPSQRAFLEWMQSGPLTLEPIGKDDLARLHQLMCKYADIPMDLADGTLVVQAERLELNRILTVDADFTVYRLKRHKAFINLFPLP
jgi:uncharacterized protein